MSTPVCTWQYSVSQRLQEPKKFRPMSALLEMSAVKQIQKKIRMLKSPACFKFVLSKKPSFQSYKSPVNTCSTDNFLVHCYYLLLLRLNPLFIIVLAPFPKFFPWRCSRRHALQPERITRHLQTLSFGIHITYCGLVKLSYPLILLTRLATLHAHFTHPYWALDTLPNHYY